MPTREFDYTGFTRVDVGGAFDVEIAQSDSFSVSVDASEGLIDHLEVSCQGDTLRVGRKWRAFDWRPRMSRPSARITMPLLKGLSLGGATRGEIRGFNSSEGFELDLSGASKLSGDLAAGKTRLELSGASLLELSGSTRDLVVGASGASRVHGDLTAGKTRLELTGASRVELSGSATGLVVDASGASHADLDRFEVDDADAKLTGAIHSTVNVRGRLSANLSGASALRWVGEPSMGDISVTGASTLKKK